MEAGSTISLIENLYSIATNHLSCMFLAFSLVQGVSQLLKQSDWAQIQDFK